MYEYRKLTPAQRQQVVAQRRRDGFPLHAPPHFAEGEQCYLLTAAIFEHRPLMAASERRSDFAAKLIVGAIRDLAAKVFGWVVLPNHYHLLASVNLDRFRNWIRLLHSGIATQWNREDNCVGRKVWYRFADRQIRSDRHYHAALNYIHANPVKHGCVRRADEWIESSFHEHCEALGREQMRALWREYPPDKMGEGWDA